MGGKKDILCTAPRNSSPDMFAIWTEGFCPEGIYHSSLGPNQSTEPGEVTLAYGRLLKGELKTYHLVQSVE